MQRMRLCPSGLDVQGIAISASQTLTHILCRARSMTTIMDTGRETDGHNLVYQVLNYNERHAGKGTNQVDK